MTEVVQDPLLAPTEERGLDLSSQPTEDDATPLAHDEIEEARARIVSLHPYVKAKLNKLFPAIGCIFCDCCFSCCAADETELLEKMKEIKRFERENENGNLDKVFNKFGVEYTG
jgi:predicted nucleic acid-binding Zn ribbon protein